MKTYKTEIKLNDKQKEQYNQTIGVCRFVYNLYIERNQEIYKTEKKFITAYTFHKWLNNDYIPNNPDKLWIKEAYSKSVKKTILNAELAFKRFFKKQSKFPRFKKKNRNDCNFNFVKNNNTDLKCQRHRIKIPKLGWIRIKEYGYLPTEENIIKSGTITKHAGRYYTSVLTRQPAVRQNNNINPGIGIDLGIKNFAVLSNGKVYKNINKTNKIKKLKKKLKREQHSLSRKLNRKGGATGNRNNLNSQILKVQKLYQRITNIRLDYINKVVIDLVRTKPEYITIEDLNIKGMMKNRHLSRSIAEQCFNIFTNKLKYKSWLNNIEIRQTDKFYPSSKICSCCGRIKQDLKLSDRIYSCQCGNLIDRDWNAGINLKNANRYKVCTDG